MMSNIKFIAGLLGITLLAPFIVIASIVLSFFPNLIKDVDDHDLRR